MNGAAAFGLTMALMFSPLALVYSANQEDTLLCYGNNLKKLISGARETTDRSFDCPSCVQSKLCPADSETCFYLQSTEVHVFKSGNFSQPPIQLPAACSAMEILESSIDPGLEYLVRCSSSPPRYTPRIQYIVLHDEEAEYRADGGPESSNPTQSYAATPDNFVILPGSRDYTAAMLEEPNKILVDGLHKKTIEDCAEIQRLHRAPASNGNLEMLVDCVDSNGANIRQLVSILDDHDNLRFAVPTNVILPAPLPNDTVHISPGGSFILYRGTSQVVIIRKSTPLQTPGIVDFTGPIAEAEFLNDTYLLISIPGQNRMLIDLSTFFATNFDGGKSELAKSQAHCPLGKCSPFVYDQNKLYLFAVDTDTPSYLDLVVFDLGDTTVERREIWKVLKSDVFDLCFPVTAELPVTTTSSTQPPTTTPQPTTTPSQTTATTPSQTTTAFSPATAIGLVLPSHLGVGEIVGICIGGIAFLALVVVVIVVLLIATRRKRCCKGKASKHGQDSDLPTIVLPLASPNIYKYTTVGQPQSAVTSSAGSSANPSFPSSLNSSQEHINFVPPHSETPKQHFVLPPELLIKNGSVAPTQMVLNQDH